MKDLVEELGEVGRMVVGMVFMLFLLLALGLVAVRVLLWIATILGFFG